MDDAKMLKILHRALDNACEFIRKNPPSDFGAFAGQSDLIDALIDGGEDPKGMKYAEVFLTRAVLELRKEGKI